MKKPDLASQPDVQGAKLSRRARLQALLFTSAAFGTTLLTLGMAAEPKVPPYKSE